MREAADNHYGSPFVGENPNKILDDAIESFECHCNKRLEYHLKMFDYK